MRREEGDFLFNVMTLIHEVKIKNNVMLWIFINSVWNWSQWKFFTTVVLKWIHFDVHTNKIFSVWEILSAYIIKDYCEEWYEVLSTLRACVRACVRVCTVYMCVWRQEIFARFSGQTKILFVKHFLSKEKKPLLLSAAWIPTAASLEPRIVQTCWILSFALSNVRNYVQVRNLLFSACWGFKGSRTENRQTNSKTLHSSAFV